jgi:hypothetical protein
MTQQSGSTSQTASQRSEGHQDEVRQIKDKGLDQHGRTVYRVSWKRTGSHRQPDEWVLSSDMNSPELIAKFERGERAVDSDDDEDDYESFDPPDEADPKAAHPYRPYFERGYWSIVRAIWPQASQHHAIPDDLKTSEDLQLELVGILASIPWALLSSICGAGIQRRKNAYPEFERFLDANFEASAAQLCIYLFEYCNREGLSLRQSKR